MDLVYKGVAYNGAAATFKLSPQTLGKNIGGNPGCRPGCWGSCAGAHCGPRVEWLGDGLAASLSDRRARMLGGSR